MSEEGSEKPTNVSAKGPDWKILGPALAGLLFFLLVVVRYRQVAMGLFLPVLVLVGLGYVVYAIRVAYNGRDQKDVNQDES